MKEKNTEKYNEDDSASIGKIALITGTVTFKIVLIFLILVGLYLGGRAAYKYGYNLFNGSTMEKAPGTDVKITVTETMSHSQLISLLQKKGLISDATGAKILLAIFTNSSYDILPGEYTLNTSMTFKEMIEDMVGVIATEEATSDHLGLYD